MPKSAKQKKEKVADFSKAKLKLGKGRAAANNAIDTSFKARSIVLPSQSIAVDKDDSEPVTRRQLNFSDLISHLKHYNAGQRKDAILGLRELYDAHWDLLESSFTPLINAVVRVIGDEDASVRKQLIAFLNWLLPKIPTENLVPHSPSLLLFTTSAQTHIFPEIRIDAIRVLDILLECIPRSVVAGWCERNDSHGSRVLGGYLGILNAGTKYGEYDGPLNATSTASVVLTPGSKLVVLRSLSMFLRIALSPHSQNESRKSSDVISSNAPLDAIFMRNIFPSGDAYQTFNRLLQCTLQSSKESSISQQWLPMASTDHDLCEIFPQHYPLLQTQGSTWNIQELASAIDASGGKASVYDSNTPSLDFISHLANTLHSTIVETYLDSAPAVFSPGTTPSETQTQLIVVIARIAQSLYHAIMQPPIKVDQSHIAHLETIIGYMAPYFPASTRDGKLEPYFEEFNLIFCELISLAVNATTEVPTSRGAQRRMRGTQTHPSISLSKSKATTQTVRVTQFITRRLRGEPASSGHVGIPISPMAYRALLPTIWALISSARVASKHEADGILHAVLDHAVKVGSKSTCKRLSVEFVARLMLLSLEKGYYHIFDWGHDPALQEKFDAWLLHLPQVLWELGGNSLPTTEVILRVLLRVLQRRPKGMQVEITASLQSRLVPYFYMDRTSRGALAGPYKKLPAASSSKLRLLALDMAGTLMGLEGQGRELEGLLKAVGLAVIGEEEQVYWNHVLDSYIHKQ